MAEAGDVNINVNVHTPHRRLVNLIAGVIVAGFVVLVLLGMALVAHAMLVLI